MNLGICALYHCHKLKCIQQAQQATGAFQEVSYQCFQKAGLLGVSWWLSGEESACSVGDTGDVVLTCESGRSLEEGTATHSSILAWRIPWTEEPGGLQSTGLQRVT